MQASIYALLSGRWLLAGCSWQVAAQFTVGGQNHVELLTHKIEAEEVLGRPTSLHPRPPTCWGRYLSLTGAHPSHIKQCTLCLVQGRPIYIQHLGAIDLKRIYELTTEERMLKFHVQEYERCLHVIMPACSKAVGRHIEQTFAILDVKGEPVASSFSF